MKFSIEQSVFNQAITEAQRFVGNKVLTPTLAGILFSVDETQNTLTLRSASPQAQYQTVLPVTGAKSGEVVIPASVVGSVVKAFESGEVTFELDGDTVVAQQKKVKYTLSPLPAEDFPAPPQISGQEITLPREAFLTTCETVSVSASRDETKPVLTSLLLEMSSPNALVTSDGFRLYRHEVDLSLDTPKSVLIPSRAIKEVLGIMKRLDSPVITAHWQEETGQLLFVLGQTVVQMSLVSGEFPPYRKIIPEATSFSITLDRELFQQRLQQVMVMARELSSIVVFQPVPGDDGVELEISSQASVKGASSATAPALQIEGDVPKFACNGTYVLDFLSSLESPDITLSGVDPLKPILMTVPGRKEILALVMPFKLQS